jgi:hypothetical protein
MNIKALAHVRFVIDRRRTRGLPRQTNERADGGFDENHVVVALSLLVTVLAADSHSCARQARVLLLVKDL